MNTNSITTQVANTGKWIMPVLSFFTLFTFVISFLTPPLSGPLCEANCYDYPFHGIADRFPRDYYWMYAATLLNILVIPVLVTLFYSSDENSKIQSLSGLILGVSGSLILIIDYFIQLSVIQPSLLRNETEGIAILSQYNSHGIFIAMEEIGYLLQTISFLFFGLQFRMNGVQKGIKITFLTGFILSILSLLLISYVHGIFREYVYEIVAISIVWLVFIINGILLSLYYRKLA